MNFVEVLASAITLALLAGIATLWINDDHRFQTLGRSAFTVLAGVTILAVTYSVGYGSGANEQWRADTATVRTAAEKVNTVRSDHAEKKIDDATAQLKIVGLFPYGLPVPGLFATSIPAWFWICDVLILLELVVLLQWKIPPTVAARPIKAEDKDVGPHD